MARRTQASTSFFLMLMFSAATAASAQLVGGAIHGTVKDAQGAVLPGAAIVVRNVATGVMHEQTSDQTGHYQVLALPPGRVRGHRRPDRLPLDRASRDSLDGRANGRRSTARSSSAWSPK